MASYLGSRTLVSSSLSRLIGDFLLNDFVALAKVHGLRPETSGILPLEFRMLMVCLHEGVFNRGEVRGLIRARLQDLHG